MLLKYKCFLNVWIAGSQCWVWWTETCSTLNCCVQRRILFEFLYIPSRHCPYTHTHTHTQARTHTPHARTHAHTPHTHRPHTHHTHKHARTQHTHTTHTQTTHTHTHHTHTHTLPSLPNYVLPTRWATRILYSVCTVPAIIPSTLHPLAPPTLQYHKAPPAPPISLHLSQTTNIQTVTFNPHA